MMFENFWHKKEKPFAGFAGFGGGATSLSLAGSELATGGTVIPAADSGNPYTYHVFTETDTLKINSGDITTIQYLVIGGGGSSYGCGSGGGGAGGLRTNVPGSAPGGPGGSAEAAYPVVAGNSYEITVGDGGGPFTPGGLGSSPGGHSELDAGGPNPIKAEGGGFGRVGNGSNPRSTPYGTSAGPGGCGGGAGAGSNSPSDPNPVTQAKTTGGTGNTVAVTSGPSSLTSVPTQGYSGGFGMYGGPASTPPAGGWGTYAAGGGGGSGSAGQDAGGPAGPTDTDAKWFGPAGNGGDGSAHPAFSGPIVGPAIPAVHPKAPYTDNPNGVGGLPTNANTAFLAAVGPTGVYAGGGAGGNPKAPTPHGGVAAGGPGGGGDINVPGADFTGSGAGGGYCPEMNPGHSIGGCGIVIVRYSV